MVLTEAVRPRLLKKKPKWLLSSAEIICKRSGLDGTGTGLQKVPAVPRHLRAKREWGQEAAGTAWTGELFASGAGLR